MTKKEFLKKAKKRNLDIKLLEKAYDYSKKCHRGQKRMSQEPYFTHPLAVAEILMKWNLDSETVAAGLLHDIIEDTKHTKEEIGQLFGKDISDMVDGVTLLKGSDLRNLAEVQSKKHELETLRKLFLATAEDIRVVFIKFADRLHNIRTLSYLSREKQKKIASETLDIYAPLANRMAMGRLKAELEDTSFRFLNPKEYKKVEKIIYPKIKEAKGYLPKIKDKLDTIMKQNEVECEIDGRVKQLYSTYKKLKKVNYDVDKIYDILAVRIIVDNVDDCYKVMGLVHKYYKPLIYRIKDYIAVPKPNGYRSLHTTVFALDGRITEIQIRTRKMHEEAENGIAAHWKYYESKEDLYVTGQASKAKPSEAKIIEDLKNIFTQEGNLGDYNLDLFGDRIFAFSPRGDIFELPEGATTIDFAYEIHSDIAEKCIGAKVNGKMVPLSHKLDNRDIVEIVTSSGSSGPSRDWLYYAATQRAKQKIRSYLRKKDKEANIDLGRKLLDEELKIYGKKILDFSKEDWTEFLKGMPQKDMNALFAGIGEGAISPSLIAKKLGLKGEKVKVLDSNKPSLKKPKEGKSIRIKGEEENDYLFFFSGCCNPKKGEEIVGYITKGRGISVHSTSCKNINNFEDTRLIGVTWKDKDENIGYVKFYILAIDRKGLLKEITSVLTGLNLNIIDLKTEVIEGSSQVSFSVKVNSAFKKRLIKRNLETIDGVEKIETK